MSLNLRQQKFCDEYLADLNGAQAAIRAGYSPKGAAAVASRMLCKKEVKEYLERCRQAIEESRRVGRGYIVDILKEIVQRSMNAVPLTKYNHRTRQHDDLVYTDGDVARPLYTFDVAGTLRALELLAHHIGFFGNVPDAQADAEPPKPKPEEEMFDIRTLYPDYDPFSHCVNKEAVIERYRRDGRDIGTAYMFPKNCFPYDFSKTPPALVIKR